MATFRFLFGNFLEQIFIAIRSAVCLVNVIIPAHLAFDRATTTAAVSHAQFGDRGLPQLVPNPERSKAKIAGLGLEPIVSKRTDAPWPVKDVGQDEEPGERGGAPGARGGVAIGSAHSSLHGSVQMENPTKATKPR
ncbi:hypothetical protein [Bradyrhizobium sp. RDM4]|uniref:hypothetical protein n=1 Tax=Bradyrhizobium sp. RDM4 TaxID=3378765 RepID=UPI0038FCACE8